jgi:quinol monooxygenase YgiN
MIRHIVLFGVRSDVSATETDDLIAAIRALEGVIPEIRFFEVERDEVGGERSATFGLISHFDDIEALQRYRDHPKHQAVLVAIHNLTDWIKAWDYTIPSGAA